MFRILFPEPVAASMLSFTRVLLCACLVYGSVTSTLSCGLSGACTAPSSAAAGQFLIVDFDGTIVGLPGYHSEPTLGESPARQPLYDWLLAGGSIVILSGCEAQRLLHRCGSFFAAEARKVPAIKAALSEGRLWMCANGGGVVYRYSDVTDGWVEDRRYRDEARAPEKIAIPQEEVSALVLMGTAYINAFKAGHNTNQTLRAIINKNWSDLARILDAHATNYTPEELLTLDSETVPRIEVRRVDLDAVQVCVIGVPTAASVSFPILPILNVESVGAYTIVRVGMTHEISIAGVDKVLPLQWAKRYPQEYPPIDLRRSVAIGDNPDFNDLPMTHTGAFAFVSVDKVSAQEQLPCVTAGTCNVTVRVRGLQHGTAFFVRNLLEQPEHVASVIPDAVMTAAAQAKRQVEAM